METLKIKTTIKTEQVVEKEISLPAYFKKESDNYFYKVYKVDNQVVVDRVRNEAEMPCVMLRAGQWLVDDAVSFAESTEQEWLDACRCVQESINKFVEKQNSN